MKTATPAVPACVVVFGARVMPDGSASATLARRVAAGLAFGLERPGTVFIVSGGKGAGPLPEWQAMRRLLKDGGICDEQIIAEPHSTNTFRQVIACTKIVLDRGLSGDVWLATSRYHQMRCWLLFALNGIWAGLVPARSDRPHLSWFRLYQFWLREMIAIPCDLTALAASRGGAALADLCRPEKNAIIRKTKGRHQP